jgi:2-oxoglutarate dehydrogenase E1 component
MEDLYDYSTGGVVHIVGNNNIGFTTSPRDARAGLFPTEVAKSMGMGSPVIHVNSDYMEEVDFVGKMAAD